MAEPFSVKVVGLQSTAAQGLAGDVAGVAAGIGPGVKKGGEPDRR